MSLVHRTAHRRLRTAALVAAAATTALAPALLTGLANASAAIRPSADTYQFRSLDLQGSKVTSSTGKSLYLGVSADSSYDSIAVVAGQPPIVEAFTTIDVSLSTSSEKGFAAHPGAYEAHTWIFPQASTDELTSTSLQSGSTLGGFGSVDLTIKTKGNPVETKTCGTSTAALQNVSVTGSVSFASMSTGSKAWGSVSAHSFDFTDTSTLESSLGTEATATGCMTPIPKYACFSDADWDVTSNASPQSESLIDFSGVSADGVDAMGGSKEAKIASPAGTVRVDSVEYDGAHLGFSSTASKASVTFSATGGEISGSGKLSSTGAPKTGHIACTGGTETDRSWTAKYTGTALKAQEQVFGPITLAAAGDTGGIDVQTK